MKQGERPGRAAAGASRDRSAPADGSRGSGGGRGGDGRNPVRPSGRARRPTETAHAGNSIPGRLDRRWIAAAALLALAVVGGGLYWRSGARGSAQGGLVDPAAARAALRAVPLPDLSAVEADVRDQVAAQHQAAADMAADAVADPAALGEAEGALGRLLLAYGFEAAEPALRNAQDLQPDDSRWPYLLGHLYRTGGRLDPAAAAYARALELAPDDVPALVRLGEVEAARDRVADARRHLEAALARDPAHAQAHALLGRLAAEADDPTAAIRHFEAALAAQPMASSLHYPLALAYRDQGDAERSAAHLAQRGTQAVVMDEPQVDDLANLKRGANLYVFQGASQLRAGRFAEAAAAYEKAIAADPANAMAHLDLGLARYRQSDIPGAIAAVEQAAALDPRGNEGAKVHQALGVYRQAAGEPEAAEAAFRQAIALDPKFPDAHLGLANLLRATDRCGAAVAAYDQALALAPSRRLAHVQRALCLVKAGRSAEARAALEQAAGAFRDDVDIADALARVLAAAPDDAVRDGRRALALATATVERRRSVDTLETLAMAHAEVGDFEAAARIQSEAIDLATAQSREAWLAVLRAELGGYRAGKPNRVPWPAFLYDG